MFVVAAYFDGVFSVWRDSDGGWVTIAGAEWEQILGMGTPKTLAEGKTVLARMAYQWPNCSCFLVSLI
jgi:hypothetical protein